MPELINVKCISRTGAEVEFHVQRIVSIDGVPFSPNDSLQHVIDHLNHLTGRMTAVETILAGTAQEESDA